jgi:hypothetical protein
VQIETDSVALVAVTGKFAMMAPATKLVEDVEG